MHIQTHIHKQIRNGLGSLFEKTGRIEEAENELRQAYALCESSPNRAKNLGVYAGNLGKVLIRKGEKEEALGYFREAYR